MSRSIPALIILVVALAIAGYYGWSSSRSRSGFPAPDFRLADLSGQTHQLSSYRGRIVFLNVWATWCPPCREEMPSMEQLFRRFRDRGLVMLAVSEDTGGAELVREFIGQVGVTFPVLLDPEGVVPPRYGVTGYPETFLIDRSGKVVQHFIGPEDWVSPASVDFFERLLSAEPSRGETE